MNDMLMILIKKESWSRYCKVFFASVFCVIFFLGLMYVYFINLAVIKTAERNKNLTRLSEIKREMQSLEQVYMEKLEQLDTAYAKTLGFIEAEPNKYIYREKVVAQGSGYGQEIR